MRFKVVRTSRIVKRNIHGRVISRRHEYVIVGLRWFRKPMYLHLLPGWLTKLHNGEQMGIELTRTLYRATTFNDTPMSPNNVKWAHEVVEAIKLNPDNFVME